MGEGFLVHMLSGKQREIQQREELFLDVARQLLLEEGYKGVTIGRIAQSTRFSKGTIYQRFKSKEELIVTLGIECRKRLLEAVRSATAFTGRPRERFMAMGETIRHYARLYPHDQRILKIIDAESILEKIPEEQQATMRDHDVRMFELMMEMVQGAVDQEDLVLRTGLTPENICFACWVMVDGAFAAQMGSAPLQEIGIDDPLGEVERSVHYLLDGYGWRPLSDEWDYEKTRRHVRSAILRGAVDETRPPNLLKGLVAGGG